LHTSLSQEAEEKLRNAMEPSETQQPSESKMAA
jgi:hypothetical protein